MKTATRPKTEATVVAIPSRRDRIQPPSAKLDRSRRIPARNNVESSGSCCRSCGGRLARSSIPTTCVAANVVPSVTVRKQIEARDGEQSSPAHRPVGSIDREQSCVKRKREASQHRADKRELPVVFTHCLAA